jgi:hypothetical protein
MVLAERQDVVSPKGLKAWSHEGTRIGKIKDVVSDVETSTEYLVVSRFWCCDLVIPTDLAERSDDRVVLPFSSSFLDMAPAVSTKGGVSAEDRGRLEHFYRVRAS